MLSFSLLPSLPFFLFSFRRLRLLQPPSIPPSQYLPKHYCDHKLKDMEMDPDEFTEFLRHLSHLGIQWVVEWWNSVRSSLRSFLSFSFRVEPILIKCGFLSLPKLRVSKVGSIGSIYFPIVY